MFWKKKMATKSKKKLDQQLREVLAQQLNEKQAKLTEAEAENRKLKNDIEKMQANFDKKEEQLEKNFEEMQKKLNEMEHKQNEQQKSNDQMEKMLQTKADAEKEKDDKLKNEHKEMEEKVYKLEEQLETQKAFHKELEKKVTEQIDVTVQTKVDKMEMAHQQQKVVSEKAIFERIGELEGQQKYQKQQGEKETKASEELFSQLQNDQKKLLEKISELEKEQKQLQKKNIVSMDQIEKLQNEQKRKINALEVHKEKQMKMSLLNFRQNFWDANICHNELQITELKVHCHEGEENEIRTVFATHPIVLDKDFSGIFYFEISIKNMQKSLFFGFAAKKWWTKLNGSIVFNFGTYAYTSQGFFTINDSFDLVNNLLSFPDDLFPYVSLLNVGDEIEANFGPNFKFNL